MTEQLREMAVRLAAAILQHDGRITLSEIEALPIVLDRQEAQRVANRLRELFNVSFSSRRVPGTLGGWDAYITLDDPGEVATAIRESEVRERDFEDALKRATRKVHV